MDNDRDPWLCGRCEIVNPWLNESCRMCDQSRQDVEKIRDPEPSPEGSKNGAHGEGDGTERQETKEPPLLPDESRRFNTLATVIGLMVLAAANWLGTGLVLSWARDASPEFEEIARQFEQAPPGEYEPSDEQKKAVSGVIKVLVGYLAFAVLVLPFVIGLALGRTTGRLTEAAWAMGIGATIQHLSEINGLLIAFVVVVMVSLSVTAGVLGALFGAKWKRQKNLGNIPRG